jgi:hypothetical protein
VTRERLAWLLVVVGLALGAWWLSVNTEWVDEDSRRPAQGEAHDNPVYAFEQLLRRLGMHAEHHESLATMPPAQARLVLLSSDWELMPERAEQLHQWVARGGHLVVMQHDDWQDTALARWVPVNAVYVKATERPKPASAASAAMGGLAKAAATPTLMTLASTPPLWGETEMLVACQGFASEWSLRAKPGQAVTWSLTRVDGTPTPQAVLARPAKPAPQLLRVPVGQGSVTVLNAENALVFNAHALRCDHPLLLAAALQAEPGAVAWIYLHEKREALLPWLWHRGWIALVIGGLALAAALWRGAVRFGPRLAAPPRLRRSISEQVRGLGAYLQGGGREALLAAQQRALHEAAARTLPRYARQSVAERVRAVAAATGLAADELSTAISTRHCTRAELPQRLQVLEAARRRLQRTSDERHPT